MEDVCRKILFIGRDMAITHELIAAVTECTRPWKIKQVKLPARTREGLMMLLVMFQ